MTLQSGVESFSSDLSQWLPVSKYHHLPRRHAVDMLLVVFIRCFDATVQAHI